MNASPSTLASPRAEPRARPGRRRGADAAVEPLTPARASGLELLGRVDGSGYKEAPSLVRRADGQTLQLTPLLYEIVAAIDGSTNSQEIAAVVGERIARHVTADDVDYLIAQKLRPLGLLRRADGDEPIVKKADPLLGLRLRKIVTNRDVTRRITSPFAKLFHPIIVIPMLLAFGGIATWVLLEKGLASAAHQAFYEPGVLLVLFALTMLSAAFHEIGHAAAATYGGAAPGAMGVALYLVWPAFYTDVTDSYRLGRGGRLRVDLGGLYFNAIVAVASLGVWALSGWDALLLLIPAQLFHMLFQLVPFVRFDGYHILADLTGVPDLFARIKPTLLHMHPKNWRKPEAKVLKPWARAVVTLWVLAVIPVLGFAFVMMVRVLPRVAATAWDSIALRWDVLVESWGTGAPAEVAVGTLSIVAIALPVLSMTYLIARVVRRTGRSVWRSTEDRPKLRVLAVIAAIVATALLAWEWWPDGQYRPIESTERGTLFASGPPANPPIEVEPAVAQAPVDMAMVPPASSGTLRPQLVMVLSPEGVPVTDPGPKRIVPVSALSRDSASKLEEGAPLATPPSLDEAEGEWIFPFDPPPPPREGDNQALAVNTTDGSTVYDVAFAVVWLSDQNVDEINEAWAAASCERCNTVAVAFQAVFVVGESNVIVPQNKAVAVNYGCDTCQTTAIAIQLVTTLNEVPSEAAMAELQVLFDELEELERIVEELPLQEVYDQLKRIEQAIVDVLVEDGALVVPQDGALDPGAEIAPTPTESASIEEEESEAPLEGSEDATTPEEPVESSEPSPAPSEEPSPAPTEEPSPAPSEEPSPAPTEEPTAEEPSPEPT